MRSQVNHHVYRNKFNDHFIYVVMYVDNMSLVGNNMDLIKEMKLQLSPKFDMKDLGATNLILGIKLKRDRAGRRL